MILPIVLSSLLTSPFGATSADAGSVAVAWRACLVRDIRREAEGKTPEAAANDAVGACLPEQRSLVIAADRQLTADGLSSAEKRAALRSFLERIHAVPGQLATEIRTARADARLPLPFDPIRSADGAR